MARNQSQLSSTSYCLVRDRPFPHSIRVEFTPRTPSIPQSPPRQRSSRPAQANRYEVTVPFDGPAAAAASPGRQGNAPTAQMQAMALAGRGDLSASAARLRRTDEPLYASIVAAVKTVCDDDGQSASLRRDTLQRLRIFFKDGASANAVTQIIDCVVDMVIGRYSCPPPRPLWVEVVIARVTL